jgi:hypothetical protein
MALMWSVSGEGPRNTDLSGEGPRNTDKANLEANLKGNLEGNSGEKTLRFVAFVDERGYSCLSGARSG